MDTRIAALAGNLRRAKPDLDLRVRWDDAGMEGSIVTSRVDGLFRSSGGLRCGRRQWSEVSLVECRACPETALRRLWQQLLR